jgi:PKD repeat protein
MRIGPAVAFVFVLFMVGCSGGSSNGSGGGGTPAPSAPTANAGGPYAGIAGTGVTFSSTGSSDPQGQALTYAWNFGDNATGSGVSPIHTYAAAGTFTVTLTVTDTSGLTGTTTAKTTIGAGPLVDVPLTGSVMSGAQPVVGAHVYLLAANTTGYGGNAIAASSTNASVSLLSAARTRTVDAVGAYVTTGINGTFSLSGDYSCMTGQQLYLYALGGNAGQGTNSALGMMAVVGGCPASTATAISATVNEVTTVAAAYALAGFATDATHVSSSGTALAQVGIANAFANAGNIATLSTGAALATTPASNGTVPQAEINTLGNILAGCVNATGASESGCTGLFANAESGGAGGTGTGTVATDTASAAINIAHNPGANVAALYALGNGTTFSPGLSALPNDWTMQISIPRYCTSELKGGVAIDGSGDAWFADGVCKSVTEFSSVGAFLSPLHGWSLPPSNSLDIPNAIALDESGNVWIVITNAQTLTGRIVEMTSTGSFLSGTSGFTIGTSSVSEPLSIAIDIAGNAWTGGTFSGYGGVAELSPTGTVLSGGQGYLPSGYQIVGIGFDGTGNAWAYENTNATLTKLSSSGAVLSTVSGIYVGSGGGTIAIDTTGNVWVSGNSYVTKISNTGSLLSGSNGYALSPIVPFSISPDPSSIGIDGSGDVWVGGDFGLFELSNSGAELFDKPSSPAMGYPECVAVDGSGDVWAGYAGAYVEFIGAATPVITPIVAGLPAKPTANGSSNLGTRP